jgi:hypothetical protein
MDDCRSRPRLRGSLQGVREAVSYRLQASHRDPALVSLLVLNCLATFDGQVAEGLFGHCIELPMRLPPLAWLGQYHPSLPPGPDRLVRDRGIEILRATGAA